MYVVPPEVMQYMIKLTEEKHAQLKANLDLEEPEAIAEYFVNLLSNKMLHNENDVQQIAHDFIQLTAHILAAVSHSVSSLPRVRPTPLEVLDHITERARVGMVEANLHLRMDMSDATVRKRVAEILQKARK